MLLVRAGKTGLAIIHMWKPPCFAYWNTLKAGLDPLAWEVSGPDVPPLRFVTAVPAKCLWFTDIMVYDKPNSIMFILSGIFLEKWVKRLTQAPQNV